MGSRDITNRLTTNQQYFFVSFSDSNYFIGMLIASCLSVLCMLILAGVVYYLASKQAAFKNRVESLTQQQNAGM